jgi:hypothetical protein
VFVIRKPKIIDKMPIRKATAEELQKYESYKHKVNCTQAVANSSSSAEGRGSNGDSD